MHDFHEVWRESELDQPDPQQRLRLLVSDIEPPSANCIGGLTINLVQVDEEVGGCSGIWVPYAARRPLLAALLRLEAEVLSA